MNFKLSDREIQEVNSIFSEAVDSLLSAADRLEALEQKLQNEFAAISHEHQLQIEIGTTRMSSAFWRIKLQNFRTKGAERTVSQLPQKGEAAQGELPGLIA